MYLQLFLIKKWPSENPMTILYMDSVDPKLVSE